MLEKLRLTKEEIKKARLLTLEEISKLAEEAGLFAKDNPEAYYLRLRELTGALSGQKIVNAQFSAIQTYLDSLTDEEVEKQIADYLLRTYGDYESETHYDYVDSAKQILPLVRPLILQKREVSWRNVHLRRLKMTKQEHDVLMCEAYLKIAWGTGLKGENCDTKQLAHKLWEKLNPPMPEGLGEQLYKMAVYPEPEWDIFKDCNSAHKIQAFTNQILALVRPLILKEADKARKEVYKGNKVICNTAWEMLSACLDEYFESKPNGYLPNYEKWASLKKGE